MSVLLDQEYEVASVVEVETMEVALRRITAEAKDINSYEFVSLTGEDLPAFTAGAHIDVYVAPGVIRQYSLCNDSAERQRYVIAVLKDSQGRGGSTELHNAFKVQDVITISRPRNNFELNRGAAHTILLAGGIGITPLKSMAHELESQGASFELHYCTRTPQSTAFTQDSDVCRWLAEGKLKVHWDQGNPEQGLNLPGLLAKVPEGTHVYYCGPSGFMQACQQASAHWPQECVHYEHFKAPVSEKGMTTHTNEEYSVRIASTGQLITVSSNEPLTESLQKAGITIPTSCVSGLCGTCTVRYLEGEVDHQDYILGSDEQKQFLTACVSHAKTELLVLDL